MNVTVTDIDELLTKSKMEYPFLPKIVLYNIIFNDKIRKTSVYFTLNYLENSMLFSRDLNAR